MPPNTKNPEKEEERLARRKDYKLWIWVTLAFVIAIVVWTLFIYFAHVHQPEVIPVEAS